MRPDTAWQEFEGGIDGRYHRGLYLRVQAGEDRWTWSVHREPGAPAIFASESVGRSFAKRYAEEHADDVADIEACSFAPAGDHLAAIELGGEA